MKQLIAIFIFVATLMTSAVGSARASEAPTPWLATYYDKTIDLREGWGPARACTSDGVETDCFDTEKEMDRFLGGGLLGFVRSLVGAIVPLSNCSSNLRLYSATSYGGSVLNLSLQGSFINLSIYSFDNITSSYKVGACDTILYDGASGGGSVYPGVTTAGAQATTMVAFWDNRISSVYIF